MFEEFQTMKGTRNVTAAQTASGEVAQGVRRLFFSSRACLCIFPDAIDLKIHSLRSPGRIATFLTQYLRSHAPLANVNFHLSRFWLRKFSNNYLKLSDLYKITFYFTSMLRVSRLKIVSLRLAGCAPRS